MSGRRGPPRMPGRLLDLLDPSGSVRGDLDEEYSRYQTEDRRRLGADLWYWGQALRSLPHLAASRASLRSRPGILTTAFGQASAVLRRRPGPAVLVIVTFGLAVGVNTSVFSLVHGVVLQDLPYANADRLVRLHPDALFYIGIEGAGRVADAAESAERILPWGRTLFTLTGTTVAAELRGGLVAHDHFQALGSTPLLGRAFRLEDAQAWPTPPVILSYAVWVRRFGEDPSVVGTTIEVGGQSRLLVGVMGPDHVPMEPDWEAWAPLPSDIATAGDRALALNALLRPEVTLDAAIPDLRGALASAWAADGVDLSPQELGEIRVVPLSEQLLGHVRAPMAVLLAAVAFVLLLACTNVANLLLVQGSRRRTEWAVRGSLGADRPRILAQAMAEVALLAACGGVVALLLAWGFRGWASTRLPADLPRADQWTVGGAAILYTMAASLVAALLAGGLPAWILAREGGRATALRRGGRRGQRRLSSTLVAIQTAFAVVLVISAGLMVRSFAAVTAQDPGFQAEGAVAVRVAPPRERYDDAQSLTAFYRAAREAASASPGIEAVGGILFLPMTPGGAWASFRSEDQLGRTDDLPSTSWRTVTPGYFQSMGIPVLSGRAPDDRDGAETQAIAAINQTLARRAFGAGTDPVGRTLYLGGGDDPEAVLVVGVVGDVRQTDPRAVGHPEVYRPISQDPARRMYLVARSTGDDTSALAALQAAILSVDDGVVLSRAAPVRQVVAGTYRDARLLTELLGLFSVLALILGAVGIYGVTAHAVAARRREMGIRLALGAGPDRLVRRTLWTGLSPVAVGTGAGLALASLTSRAMESLLYGVEALDPLTFALVAVLLAGVSLLAVGGQVVRAGRTDPAGVLKAEG